MYYSYNREPPFYQKSVNIRKPTTVPLEPKLSTVRINHQRYGEYPAGITSENLFNLFMAIYFVNCIMPNQIDNLKIQFKLITKLGRKRNNKIN